MKIEDFIKIFEKYNSILELDLSDNQYNELYYYMNSLLEWNKKINVTSITDEKEFVEKHFIDSLTINKYIKNCNSVIDIGTGAGFPGIPLKIINKDKKITLIDSVGKKLKVIESINEVLELKNLEIIHIRAEELANNNSYRENYDASVSRAVSNISTIMEYMLPFVRVGGEAICMKGPNYQKELEEADKSINILGGKIHKIHKITINENMTRNIIIIKKIKETPSKYPRKQGKPLKEPIK